MGEQTRLHYGDGERHNSWWYRRSVVCVVASPERLPLALLAPVEGAEVADGMRPVFPPAHPRQLQPLAHHRLARALHGTAADVPALGQVFRVVHPVRVTVTV